MFLLKWPFVIHCNVFVEMNYYFVFCNFYEYVEGFKSLLWVVVMCPMMSPVSPLQTCAWSPGGAAVTSAPWHRGEEWCVLVPLGFTLTPATRRARWWTTAAVTWSAAKCVSSTRPQWSAPVIPAGRWTQTGTAVTAPVTQRWFSSVMTAVVMEWAAVGSRLNLFQVITEHQLSEILGFYSNKLKVWFHQLIGSNNNPDKISVNITNINKYLSLSTHSISTQLVEEESYKRNLKVKSQDLLNILVFSRSKDLKSPMIIFFI